MCTYSNCLRGFFRGEASVLLGRELDREAMLLLMAAERPVKRNTLFINIPLKPTPCKMHFANGDKRNPFHINHFKMFKISYKHIII